MAPLGVVAAATISVPLMKCSLIVLCLRLRARLSTIGQMYVVSSSHPALNDFWKVNKHGAFFHTSSSSWSRSSDQSCNHETWLHLHFVDLNNKWNHQAHYNGNIRLKERPASSGHGAQKRHIIDVLSDHSLHLRSLVLRLLCSSSRCDLLSSDAWPDRHKWGNFRFHTHLWCTFNPFHFNHHVPKKQTCSSPIKDKYFHEESSQPIVFTP